MKAVVLDGPGPPSALHTPKFRDHAPDDPAFFLGHLSRSVFEAGIWQVVQDKWDGIREAFHGFDPAQVAAMTPTEIAATETTPT
jgi:3-methyladenine DNA glycosylase Tag